MYREQASTRWPSSRAGVRDMKMIYEVFGGEDKKSIGLFETKALAERAARKQGASASIVEREVYTRKDKKQEKRDKKAIKKLSSDQVAALQRLGANSQH